MINFDDYVNENKGFALKPEQFKVAIYSRSFVQNTNNRRFRIWKNESIAKLNKQPA